MKNYSFTERGNPGLYILEPCSLAIDYGNKYKPTHALYVQSKFGKTRNYNNFIYVFVHRDRRSMSRPQLIPTPYRTALSVACLLSVLFTARMSGENTAATVHKIVWSANISDFPYKNNKVATTLQEHCHNHVKIGCDKVVPML